jgi:hypothetical protein
MIRPRIAAAALLLTLATPAAAQTAPAGLRQRMDAFTAVLRDPAPTERIASFFPRRAEWEFVDTALRPGLAPVVTRTRIGPGRTLAAIRDGGDLCESFVRRGGEHGSSETSMVMQAQLPWRYAARHRFVPRGRRADWPGFVEWMREDGAWVISRIGEANDYWPKVLGIRAGPRITRDTLAGIGLPAERRFATATQWFADRRPLHFMDELYVVYHLPRRLFDHEIERFGSVGVVPVFIERDPTVGREVVYVLTGPGEYQPYQSYGRPTCRADSSTHPGGSGSGLRDDARHREPPRSAR